MPGRYSQAFYGQEQWAQADLDWIGIYPDAVPRRRSMRRDLSDPFYFVDVSGYDPFALPPLAFYPDEVPRRRSTRRGLGFEFYSEPYRVVTVEMFSSMFGTDYPDRVPEFKPFAYTAPTYFATSPISYTSPEFSIGWLPDYPDYIRPKHRAYLDGGMFAEPGFSLAVRPEPTVAELAAIFGTEWPDLVPKYSKNTNLYPVYIGPIRTPGLRWVEPAITAISTSWTEPAITAISSVWTEPALATSLPSYYGQVLYGTAYYAARNENWTEPAIAPTTGEDD